MVAFLLTPLFLSGFFELTNEETIIFQVKTTKETNFGTPFYVLVKSTDLPHFLTDDYQKVAHQNLLKNEDPEYLNTTFLLPGETKTIEVKSPKNKSTAIYFIFTHPGEEWKYIVNEEGPHKVKILLSQNEIACVNSFK